MADDAGRLLYCTMLEVLQHIACSHQLYGSTSMLPPVDVLDEVQEALCRGGEGGLTVHPRGERPFVLPLPDLSQGATADVGAGRAIVAACSSYALPPVRPAARCRCLWRRCWLTYRHARW